MKSLFMCFLVYFCPVLKSPQNDYEKDLSGNSFRKFFRRVARAQTIVVLRSRWPATDQVSGLRPEIGQIERVSATPWKIGKNSRKIGKLAGV